MFTTQLFPFYAVEIEPTAYCAKGRATTNRAVREVEIKDGNVVIPRMELLDGEITPYSNSVNCNVGLYCLPM